MTPVNPQFTKCTACDGSGKDREDHLNQCGTCCGEGSLIFCDACCRYGVCDHQIGSIPGVCRSCRGEVQSMVKLAGVSASEALAMLAQPVGRGESAALDQRGGVAMALPYVARIDNNRLQKAMRFYHRFLDQMRATVPNPELDKAALETALALVRSASTDQWKQVAKEMTKENEATARKHGSAHWKVEDAPSGQTFELIVSIFEKAIATADARKRDWTEDGAIVTELFRQRGTGSVGAQVALEEEG